LKVAICVALSKAKPRDHDQSQGHCGQLCQTLKQTLCAKHKSVLGQQLAHIAPCCVMVATQMQCMTEALDSAFHCTNPFKQNALV